MKGPYLDFSQRASSLSCASRLGSNPTAGAGQRFTYSPTTVRTHCPSRTAMAPTGARRHLAPWPHERRPDRTINVASHFSAACTAYRADLRWGTPGVDTLRGRSPRRAVWAPNHLASMLAGTAGTHARPCARD